ncbi:MAG: 4-alpha-glucanotransferase [Blastocatellia bacterium]|nr:MAG: 4-alpha-glucanotransferase [Blastocatellia bacterium]
MTFIQHPPFPQDYRASGLLLHVTSLPSPFGIGDVGPAAVAWIDRLHDAGQRWWQALPLGPTGYGNSPYQPVSSFAGNDLLISPDWLIEDELLRPEDSGQPAVPPNVVDYETVVPFKRRLLETAWVNFSRGARPDLSPAFEQFRFAQGNWVEDYALFLALKARFDGSSYLEWPAPLVHREPSALDRVRGELARPIDQECFAQFLLFRQAERLQAYARRKGVGLIGDLPFFVSPDSSDVWANPGLFLLDEEHRPRFVAGVPPDYFSALGQLWGNPVYDWAALQKGAFRWCIDRLRALMAHVDVIRLDHFRGFAAAWHVPAAAATAQSGSWIPAPGGDFFRAVKKQLSALPFIVEDLGVMTTDVFALRDEFRLPGTRVLQFAFDGHDDNPHLPPHFVTNAVVYTGTHDNPTTRGWFEDLSKNQQQNVWRYVKRQDGTSGDAAPALIEAAWSSMAALAIAPLQDVLNLGQEARMNVPGHAEGNWRWRCTEDMLADAPFERLRDVTKASNRQARGTPLDDDVSASLVDRAIHEIEVRR